MKYTLRVLQVLKGQAGATIELNGEGDLSGIWDTTFSDHVEDEFWSKSSGRMGINGDCSMISPHFMIGKRYLVMHSSLPDTKHFERVDNDDDRWFKYVKSRTLGVR
ncbi:hypothetical protein [Massilia sp. CCM 8734]|uniref:hypothetical protein n=1 Tax=Massilia sp. CCM 8734 TaxID=2609283 RepID=UPI00141F7D73|nr:hypothetical protein [Massilia sp. CCM 8734]NHZ97611.1 hypothetical protein [Massilia sp. CCM 8734]